MHLHYKDDKLVLYTEVVRITGSTEIHSAGKARIFLVLKRVVHVGTAVLKSKK
jgi:hypothetical protein